MKQFRNIVLLILTIFMISSCAERKEWKYTQQSNNISTYQDFLKKYPKGKYSENARIALEKLEWDETVKSQLLGAYCIFLKKYPKSQFASDAKLIIDKLRIPLGKDGGLMVLIPEGEFQMGCNDGLDDEKPVHTVYLDSYYIDVYEVTNAQYKKFVDETGYKKPFYWNDKKQNGPKQPVLVSWIDAVAYCKWAGKRLPTEAEWEKAARGGLIGKKYPNGDKLFHDDANYYGIAGIDYWEKSADVGSFHPNGYGLFDMAGNVSEFCSDWYDKTYYSYSPKRNPTGPKSEDYVITRGGSWGDEYSGKIESGLRVARRTFFYNDAVNEHIGFRCAMDAKKK